MSLRHPQLYHLLRLIQGHHLPIPRYDRFYHISTSRCAILTRTLAAEKVLVVWNAHRRRFRSKVYVGCLGVIVVYLGVIVFLIWGAYTCRDGVLCADC